MSILSSQGSLGRHTSYLLRTKYHFYFWSTGLIAAFKRTTSDLRGGLRSNVCSPESKKSLWKLRAGHCLLRRPLFFSQLLSLIKSREAEFLCSTWPQWWPRLSVTALLKTTLISAKQVGNYSCPDASTGLEYSHPSPLLSCFCTARRLKPFPVLGNTLSHQTMSRSPLPQRGLHYFVCSQWIRET